MQPCCMSTHSQSKPAWAMTSAGKQCGIDSQPPTVGLPSRHIFLTRLKRIVVAPLNDFIGAKLRDFFLRKPVLGEHFVRVLSEPLRHRADCRRSRGQAIG